MIGGPHFEGAVVVELDLLFKMVLVPLAHDVYLSFFGVVEKLTNSFFFCDLKLRIYVFF